MTYTYHIAGLTCKNAVKVIFGKRVYVSKAEAIITEDSIVLIMVITMLINSF
ncbi:hypothetical protein [Bizionia arctica]|uniref:hypothetical protein n=1 Tax=Bizionia arctica TaxID=1495645 RepID=UPI00166A1DBC|nr:hypothetical protein [Bizionia arctica]